jgi:uncharacterized membrane protein
MSGALCAKPKANVRPITRKILYAVIFEVGGILLGGLALHLMSSAPVDLTLALSTFAAVIALGWSMLFNTAFEAWETRQSQKGRSFLRRAVHAALFEGGLVLILVPATVWWLSVTWQAALAYETTLIVFFLFYAAAFTWAFDKIFGLPQSAR